MTNIGRMLPLLVLALACGALAGCGSTASSPSAGGSSTAQSAGASVDSGTAVTIDACALIDAEDVTKLLGVPVAGKQTSTDPKLPRGCMWENPANLESISLEIGNPGTAINGTLPPTEEGFPELTTPGPDGMRFLGPGSVQFAAARRTNTVQVAVLSMLSGDQANDAAVELARKIGPKLPE